jgi:hypothetical protein
VSIWTFSTATLDGAAVDFGSSRQRQLRIPAGEYATPFWVQFDGGRGFMVDTLPARIYVRCQTYRIWSALPVASVVVTPATADVEAPATTQPVAAAYDFDGVLFTGRTFAWSSDNPSAATVDPSTGLVTGVAAGSAIITATCGGQSDTCAVTVTVYADLVVASVTVSGAASVTEGGTVQQTAVARNVAGVILTGKTFTWDSSNDLVATVDTNGLVTGVAAGGPVTITATCDTVDGTHGVTVVGAGGVQPYFQDDFEVDGHVENGVYWSKPRQLVTTQAFSGVYSARSRHPAVIPATDTSDAATELRANYGGVQIGPAVWWEWYLYIPSNHFHTNQYSNRTKQVFTGLSLEAGTNVVTGPAGSFPTTVKGIAITLPGAGEAGSVGILANLHSVESDLSATLINMYNYTLNATGGLVVGTATATIPTTVSGVTANKQYQAGNHKHFMMWGHSYTNVNPLIARPVLLGELWPTYPLNGDIPGDSYLTLRYKRDGRMSTWNTASDGSRLNGVSSAGVGLLRGQWNRIRLHVDIGTLAASQAGTPDGVLQLWYNDNAIVNRADLRLYPVEQVGDTDVAKPYFSVGYMNGWLDGAFMESTDYFIDDFKMYVLDPGW